MKQLIIIFIFALFATYSSNSQFLNIHIISRLNAPPRDRSDLFPDSTKLWFEPTQIDSVEFRLYRGINRMNPEEKGPDYLELIFKCDKNGNARIDLSKLKEGDLFFITGIKDKYISLRKTFKYTKTLNNSKWIAIMIPK